MSNIDKNYLGHGNYFKNRMKPLRIAYLIFSSGLGGGELLLLNHLSHHDPKHVTPLVVCSGEGALTERLRNLNIPVHILPINREREYFCRFSLPHIRTLLKLWIWLRRNQIDLIHSYTLETRNYAHAIALLSGLPLFHTARIPGSAICLVARNGGR